MVRTARCDLQSQECNPAFGLAFQHFGYVQRNGSELEYDQRGIIDSQALESLRRGNFVN